VASINDVGTPGDPLDTPPLTEWQAAVRDTLGSDTPVDTRLAAVLPIGAIVAYGATTAPTGWHLCDGSAHGSSALQAVTGSPNTPDLRDRFVVGAGSSYSQTGTGGAATVALTINQLPVHSHPDIFVDATKMKYGTGAAGSGSIATNATGSNAIKTGNTGAGEAHPNLPPYYALTYIIRKG